MATHELKVWPEYFSALQDGTKTFEVRRNDRDFAVGDRLHLREWIPEERIEKPLRGGYTGQSVTRTVSYVLPGHVGGVFGIYGGFCVLGLIPYVDKDVV